MLTPLELGSVVLSPWLFGAGIARLCGLRYRADRIAFLGWSWLAGALATALLLFAWLVVTGAHRAFVFLLPLLALATFGASFSRGSPDRPSGSDSKRSVGEIALAIALGLSLSLTAIRCVRTDARVVSGSDEGQIWAAKAKAIYLGDGFGPEFEAIVRSGATLQHPDYPLLNPLLQVWVFLNAGEITHVENRLPMQTAALALLLLFAAVARRAAGPWIAAIAVLLLSTCAQTRYSVCLADADLLTSLGLLAALAARAGFDSANGAVHRRLYSIAMAFLVWTKNEGIMLAVAVVAADIGVRFFDRRNERSIGAFLRPNLLPAAVVMLNTLFNRAHALKNDLFMNPAVDSFLTRLAEKTPQHAPIVIDRLVDLAWTKGDERHYFSLVFLALLLLHFDRLRRPQYLREVSTLSIAFGGYMLVYLTTPHDIVWHIDLSLSRLEFQLLPSAIVCFAGVVAQATRGCAENATSG